MFTGIAHTDIDSVWPEVLPWIEKACEGMIGRALPEDIYKSLIDRESQLWVYRDLDGVSLCVVTDIHIYPRKKYARLIIVTGRNRNNWQHNLQKIEEWAKSQGCDGIESLARKGWGKLLKDYETSHIFIHKEF